MATRSFIAIENSNDSIEAIYCHWDGYPENNGAILAKYYKSENKVRALISLGSISSLRKLVNIPKGKQHSFGKPLKTVTVAYGRDRNQFEAVRKYTNFASFKRNWRNLDGEFFYVFNTISKEWKCYSFDKILHDLTQFQK